MGERCEYHLNGIPRRVHWITKQTDQIQLEWLPAIIRSNICDGNTGSTPPAQLKVMEGDFDDVPTGDCDIPDTTGILREVVWKIGAGKESTWSIKKLLRSTSCKKLISLVLIIITE